jgi:hypothetical protein
MDFVILEGDKISQVLVLKARHILPTVSGPREVMYLHPSVQLTHRRRRGRDLVASPSLGARRQSPPETVVLRVRFPRVGLDRLRRCRILGVT